MSTTVDHGKFRPHGFPPWRNLVKLSERVSFVDVARESDTAYHRVMKMSRGHMETTPEVQAALEKLFGHSKEDLAAALRLHQEMLDEGEQS